MHTLSETPAWFSRILGCMFPKTSLMIIGYIGYRRVFLKALGLDQVVCASDRAEILMPQSLQANCNSSIHGDRWWNQRVWTSSWIKLKIIWEPRIWYSCWFYCCFTGLTVFLFSHIICRVFSHFSISLSHLLFSLNKVRKAVWCKGLRRLRIHFELFHLFQMSR